MSIRTTQSLIGQIQTSSALVGECNPGQTPFGTYLTTSEVPDEGAFVQYTDGEWIVRVLANAEEVRY